MHTRHHTTAPLTLLFLSILLLALAGLQRVNAQNGGFNYRSDQKGFYSLELENGQLHIWESTADGSVNHNWTEAVTEQSKSGNGQSMKVFTASGCWQFIFGRDESGRIDTATIVQAFHHPYIGATLDYHNSVQ